MNKKNLKITDTMIKQMIQQLQKETRWAKKKRILRRRKEENE